MNKGKKTDRKKEKQQRGKKQKERKWPGEKHARPTRYIKMYIFIYTNFCMKKI